MDCLWDFPDKNTGLGCHFLLPRIFTTQGSVLGPYQISLSTIPLFSSLLICHPVFTSSPLHWSHGPSLNFLLHSQPFYLVDIIFALTWHNCNASWFQPTWFLLSSSQTSEHGKKPSYSSADWSHCWFHPSACPCLPVTRSSCLFLISLKGTTSCASVSSFPSPLHLGQSPIFTHLCYHFNITIFLHPSYHYHLSPGLAGDRLLPGVPDSSRFPLPCAHQSDLYKMKIWSGPSWLKFYLIGSFLPLG